MSNHNPELTVFQRTMLQLLWILCRGFALLPHFVRHNIFGTLCYWVLCYVLRYRRRVIMDNLRRSFPDYSEQQLNTICRDTYKNLAEQIINTLSQSGISDEELQRRMTFSNDGPTREAVGGRSAVFMTAHYGPWEAGSVVSLAFPDQTFVAVYHKITNPIVDELMKRIRRHTNVELVDMKRTMRHFIDNRQRRPMIMGLIAAFLGALGDLSASHIKRVFGVKDFGNIMPGHGGVMDRFDSILLVAPFVYCMVRYVGEFWPIIVR